MSKRFYQGLSIVIMFIIFSNSLLSAEVSSAQSGFFISTIETILGWVNLSIEIDILSLIIRKLAHFLEFLILGFTMLKGWGFKFMLNVLIILLVASLDESIQLFSEGRAFSVIDIGIDFIGGMTGMMLSKWITKI